ncbi:MAG TPA: CcmD family protein [Thermodesulfobacteriota bacterium]|nr:CcmD family protein [Thermodesulfobacteriota bacterium]
MVYLFWSQMIVWALLLGYVFFLDRKASGLKKQMDIIESSQKSEN